MEPSERTVFATGARGSLPYGVAWRGLATPVARAAARAGRPPGAASAAGRAEPLMRLLND